MSKKICLLTMAMTVMLLSALGFVSCVSETENPEATASDLVTRSVVLNVKLPSGDPVHFANTRTQSGNEFLFNSLTLLVYDAATDLLIDKIDMKGEGTTLTGPNEFNYTYTMTPERGTTARRFVVVANDPIAGVTVGDAYSDLQTELTTVVLEDNDAISTKFADLYLPMSGVAHHEADYGATVIPMDLATADNAVPVQVSLTRAVARIDVANMVPNLVITELKLINANPNGYLMPHGDVGTVAVPTSMTRVGGLTPATAISSITTADGAAVAGVFQPASAGSPAVTETPAVLKKAFYVYEDAIQDPSSTPLTMLVKGTLGTIPVYYTIPFTTANLETPSDDGKSLEIQRNRLYTLQLGNGQEITINTQMLSSLSYADWTSETVNGSFDATVFVGATTDPSTYTSQTQTFNVSAETTNIGTISVINGFYNSGAGVNIVDVNVITTSDAWQTSTGTPKTSTDGWLSATMSSDGVNESNQVVTITATSANEYATARVGSIRIKYHNTTDANEPDRYMVFSVKQAEPIATPDPDPEP